MPRPRKDWTEEARLKLWLKVVQTLAGKMTYYRMDQYFGLVPDATDRPRIFERIFKRGDTPSAAIVHQVGKKPTFEVTAEIYFSELWQLLSDPPINVRSADRALGQLMNGTGLRFPNDREWHLIRNQLALKLRFNDEQAYRAVVEHSARTSFDSDLSRLAFYVACFYRTQLRRETATLAELTIIVDNQLDVFFQACFDAPDGQDFYHLAIERLVRRQLPALRFDDWDSPLAAPPIHETVFDWVLEQASTRPPL
jgi:hypothetical protein